MICSIFFLLIRRQLRSTLFPYTTLFRSEVSRQFVAQNFPKEPISCLIANPKKKPDRKSTRLNSSHLVISYAVFCLKKKNREYFHTEVVTHSASEQLLGK